MRAVDCGWLRTRAAFRFESPGAPILDAPPLPLGIRHDNKSARAIFGSNKGVGDDFVRFL